MTAPTRDEIREAVLIDGMPPDSRQLLDYDNTSSNVWKEADAEAGAFKAHAFDLVEQLRAESLPSAATSTTHGLLEDFERAYGIPAPTTAIFYDDTSRAARVVSRVREFGASTTANILAAARAVSGTTSSVSIVETGRDFLTAANWREIPGAYYGTAIAPFADTEIDIDAADNATTSNAGARFTIRITHPEVQSIYLIMYAPDGTASGRYYFGTGSVAAQDFVFFWPAASGLGISGRWRFVITDNEGAGGTIIDPAANGVTGLLVEGIGRPDGAAAGIFEWSLAVNEAATSTATATTSTCSTRT